MILDDKVYLWEEKKILCSNSIASKLRPIFQEPVIEAVDNKAKIEKEATPDVKTDTRELVHLMSLHNYNFFLINAGLFKCLYIILPISICVYISHKKIRPYVIPRFFLFLSSTLYDG